MCIMHDKSDTTVIITTYNDSYSDLSCALGSVINQSIPPKLIIVVDDGSSNNTSSIVVNDVLDPLKSPILLLKKINGGPSSARNYGLKHCSSAYVTFLDSDDEMLENNIEIKEGCLKNLDLSYFGVYGTHIKNAKTVHKYIDNDGFMDVDLIGKENGLPGGVHTYLFRTCYLLEVDGFDESLVNNEDFDLVIRLIRFPLKAKGNLGPGFIKNYRYGSVSRNDQYIKVYMHVQRFLKKAECNNYFSLQELNGRKFSNELRLGLQLIKKVNNRRLAIKHLNLAFNYVQPKGWKQCSLCFFARVSGVVMKFFKEKL